MSPNLGEIMTFEHDIQIMKQKTFDRNQIA